MQYKIIKSNDYIHYKEHSIIINEMVKDTRMKEMGYNEGAKRITEQMNELGGQLMEARSHVNKNADIAQDMLHELNQYKHYGLPLSFIAGMATTLFFG